MSAVIVRCNKCKNERESYNDPRKSKSVIECKAQCHESHYEWTYVSGGDQEDAPPVGGGSNDGDYRKAAEALYIPPGTKLNNKENAEAARASLEKEQADKEREEKRRREQEAERAAAKNDDNNNDDAKRPCFCAVM